MSISEQDSVSTLFTRLLQAILADAEQPIFDGSFYYEIGPLVSDSELGARSAEELLEAAARPAAKLLDFGCGPMHSRSMIESFGYRWYGLDYLDAVSMSVRDKVAGLEGEISFYDGRIIPFPNESFHVIWCLLVLHHIQSVEVTFAELARVLQQGGKIIGQVAYLEQMQDFGTFNFTPYGLKVAARQAGLTLTRVYPKHDAFSFLLRRLMITFHGNDDTPFNQFMGEDGFYHQCMIEVGERLKLDVKDINLLRLLFSTHYVFEIEKL